MCAGQPMRCGAQHSTVNFCSNDTAAREGLHWYPSTNPRFPWDYCLSMPRLTPSPPAMTPGSGASG